MQYAFRSNFTAHRFKFWRSIGIYAFNLLVSTFEIAQGCQRICFVAVTDRVCHRKPCGIIEKCQAVPFGIYALTLEAFRNHMIAGDHLPKVRRSRRFGSMVSSRTFMIQFGPHAVRATSILGKMVHQMIDTASLLPKFFLPFGIRGSEASK